MRTTQAGSSTAAARLLATLVCCLSVVACGTLSRLPSPMLRSERASVEGYGEIRGYPLTDTTYGQRIITEAFATEREASYETLPNGHRRYNYLAISGGGSDGAFGAGLLNGWTKKGDRPSFKIVTGVSTGALIAPFAFLGPEYDERLKGAYTSMSADKVFIARSLLALFTADSVTDSAPLKEAIKTFVDQPMLDAIAAEQAKGRRMFVLTTDLDREEPVVWDMGAIASSDAPNRLDLFRTVLLASASIPSLFPPVFIQIKADGETYEEMHVDGGVFVQSFFVGSQLDMPAAIAAAHPDFTGKVEQRLFVIRNGRLTPSPKQVTRGVKSISVRAINSLLKVSGINDLYRLYLQTIHDNVEFHYVAIPSDYVSSTEEEFNQPEMIRQFDLGYQMGTTEIPWRELPPGYVK